MKLFWILLAAGSSTRFGGPRSKLLEPLAGRRVIDWTLESIREASPDAEILLVSSPDLRDEISFAASWTQGGARRQDSAAAGILFLEKLGAASDDVVLIHDAARPFVDAALVARVLDGLSHFDAVAPALPVTDTVKRVEGERVIETIDRSPLRRLQTPQGMRYDTALRAFRDLGPEEYTDDLAVAEARGFTTGVSAGDERNLKLTTRRDMLLAEAILREMKGQD